MCALKQILYKTPFDYKIEYELSEIANKYIKRFPTKIKVTKVYYHVKYLFGLTFKANLFIHL